MADAHRARRCILALAVILQAQEFPAGNPAAAAGSVAKGGDGGFKGKVQKARGMRRKQQEGFLGRVRGWEDTP